ncbi:hypothetical protein, partial [Pseudomonas sp. SIMBA_068]
VNVPQTRLSTDGHAWPAGHFSLLWRPEDKQMLGPDGQPEVRVRATQLVLSHIAPIVPLFAPLSPALFENWQTLQPQGTIDGLAL